MRLQETAKDKACVCRRDVGRRESERETERKRESAIARAREREREEAKKIMCV